MIAENSSRSNGGDGIQASNASTVIKNQVSHNDGFGLKLSDSGYANNVVSNNGGTVDGGVQIGGNVCNGNTLCP